MNEVKHTPGPWVADDDQYDTDVILITTIDRLERSMVEIAKIDVGFNDPFEAEQQSNARLIAAAPKMLGALKLVAGSDNWRCFEDSEWDVVTDAIAEAEGRA